MHSKEEILIWSEHLKKQQQLGYGLSKYCKENALPLRKMQNFHQRIVYKKYCNPQQYQQELAWYHDFKKSEMTISQYCKKFNINAKKVSQMQTHMKYLDIINKHTGETEHSDNNMPITFNKINPRHIASAQGAQPRPLMVSEPELIQKQNDIELVITKGIKVLVSPQVDSMKIIKIIELLKDL